MCPRMKILFSVLIALSCLLSSCRTRIPPGVNSDSLDWIQLGISYQQVKEEFEQPGVLQNETGNVKVYRFSGQYLTLDLSFKKDRLTNIETISNWEPKHLASVAYALIDALKNREEEMYKSKKYYTPFGHLKSELSVGKCNLSSDSGNNIDLPAQTTAINRFLGGDSTDILKMWDISILTSENGYLIAVEGNIPGRNIGINVYFDKICKLTRAKV